MSDIEKLIERLRARACDAFRGPSAQGPMLDAADALTRLVAPLPAEVAAFVCDLDEAWVQVDSDLPRDPAARMLESLARENARLAAMLTKSSEDNDASIEMLEERDRLAAELAEAKANERRNDMGLRAATNALNAAEGIRVDLERKLAARDSELAECKAQNRAMAETMSAFAKLDATGECTCTLTWTFYAGSDAGRAAWNACPVHAPKPAAEKP